MKTILWIVTAAYFLDLAVGDPPFPWHPVRLIGRMIQWVEGMLVERGAQRKVLGVLLVVLTTGPVCALMVALLWAGRALHPYVHFGLATVLLYFTLSVKDLAVEADRVREALKGEDLIRARKNLSMIVGRDTERLDKTEIIRAAVETVAESTMDGIVAPLFYAFLGGPVLAWFYKTVNTLDSMVGYQNDRYREFGWASAQLDAWLNYIPAKITAFLISTAMILVGKDYRSSFRWTGKHLFSGPCKNGDTAEAAMAGGLGIRLGGTNYYDSVAVRKPFLGDARVPHHPDHIQEAIRTAYVASGGMILLGWVIWGWR